MDALCCYAMDDAISFYAMDDHALCSYAMDDALCSNTIDEAFCSYATDDALYPYATKNPLWYEVLSRLRSQHTNHTRMHSAAIDTNEIEPEQQNPQYQSSRAGSRLSEECISNFLINSLGRLTKTEENIICTICQEDINVKEEIATLCCTHIYHARCIEKWLTIKNECAVCRSAVILDEVVGRDPH
ncbi:hypothetical protein KFK09_011473 [Dendrobium nobile]|uniref:RING-type E3 ubiquitin transferase n=1 Tax=Dendrobium nobile TaxID=94219 RepID=A0A8T3BEP2_DENNO|nr:hypothetical protein KFK09_011473 [Dendrobium nobile]